jgi:hypothetical protein
MRPEFREREREWERSIFKDINSFEVVMQKKALSKYLDTVSSELRKLEILVAGGNLSDQQKVAIVKKGHTIIAILTAIDKKSATGIYDVLNGISYEIEKLAALIAEENLDDKKMVVILAAANAILHNLNAVNEIPQMLADQTAKNNLVYDLAKLYSSLGQTGTKLSLSDQYRVQYDQYISVCESAFEFGFNILNTVATTPENRRLLFTFCIEAHDCTNNSSRLNWSDRIMLRLIESCLAIPCEKLCHILVERSKLLGNLRPFEFIERYDLIMKAIKLASTIRISLSDDLFKNIHVQLSQMFPDSKIASAASFCTYLDDTDAERQAEHLFTLLNDIVNDLLKRPKEYSLQAINMVLGFCKIVCNDVAFRSNLDETLVADFEEKIRQLTRDDEILKIISDNNYDAQTLFYQQSFSILQARKVGVLSEMSKMMMAIRSQLRSQSVTQNNSCNAHLSTPSPAASLVPQQSKKRSLNNDTQQNAAFTSAGASSPATLLSRENKRRKLEDKQETESSGATVTWMGSNCIIS